MKKNGQYVGVDEKYIPEEEKYVDNAVNSELKDSINNGLRSINNYVTDKDNQENLKKTGKKGLKVLKGVGIGYLVLIGLAVILVIGIIVFVIVQTVQINDKASDIFNQTSSIQERIKDQIEEQMNDNDEGQAQEGYSKAEINTFNAPFELYSGSQTGLFLESLLNKVITNNKTEATHIITVVYNDTTTTLADEITKIKQGFDDNKEYEVSLDYDTDGFVNKVTIY